MNGSAVRVMTYINK